MEVSFTLEYIYIFDPVKSNLNRPERIHLLTGILNFSEKCKLKPGINFYVNYSLLDDPNMRLHK